MRTAIGVVLVACGSSAPSPQHEVAPAAPSACSTVAPGTELRTRAPIPGARLCLAPGRHRGPIVVAPGTIVWGPRTAIIERPEGGTVVDLGPDATLLGMTVDGQGGVFARTDAAVRVTGDGARVEGVRITNAVFGVLAEQASRATIRDNHIEGSHAKEMGIRGDTIRLWETHDSVVTGNTVEGGRDFVMWYSTGNRVEDNRVVDGRYGMHFMYSHHNHVARNQYVRDVVGVWVMYSHDVALVDNVIEDAFGAAGMAIGLKDAGNITVAGNALVHDQLGIYVDNSPVQQSHTLTVTRNLFGRCDMAVVLHGGSGHARFEDNDFIANAAVLSAQSGVDPSDVTWSGNYWSDYAGYDLDGDGRGDLAYELRSLEGDLIDRIPTLAFFRDTPALGAAEAVTRFIPIYTPSALLVDASPRMRPQRQEGARED